MCMNLCAGKAFVASELLHISLFSTLYRIVSNTGLTDFELNNAANQSGMNNYN
jgi:hypothetical protein